MPTKQAAEYEPKSLEEKVKVIIAELIPVIEEDNITENANLVDDLGADSLDTVEMIMIFEETWPIDIPDDEAEKLKTYGDCVNYLRKRGCEWPR